MNIISLYSHHNATISILYEGRYYNLELERYFKERYMSIHRAMPGTPLPETLRSILSRVMFKIEKIWGIKNNFDICVYDHSIKISDTVKDVKRIIEADNYITKNHHHAHAANAFYQSSFEKSLIISYDGVGNDGNFNIYLGDKDGVKFEKSIRCKSMGILYNDIGFSISEINKRVFENYGQTTTSLSLSMAGRIMGLSAYGTVREDWINNFRKYYEGKNLTYLSKSTGLNFIEKENFFNNLRKDKNVAKIQAISGQNSYDVAATSQKVFEDLFFERIRETLNKYPDLPICIAGGCSLNVLVNEKLRQKVGNKIFIAPNTDDSGISLGSIFLTKPPKEKVKPITYTGLPILDIEDFDSYIERYKAKKSSISEISKLLKEGNIIGLLQGDSEVGPRALGNRSIICDPSYDDMKEKVNKIKQREWFRPFAPVVRLEDANKYFHFDYESPFMSFAPKVRDKYIDELSAVTHIDKTARLQTVKKEDHEFLHDLLTEFGGVLLNTSFNIKGKPIITTIGDAINVLENTELDYVYIEGYLFKGGADE